MALESSRSLISAEKGKDHKLVKQHTLKDMLYMLADAWEEGRAVRPNNSEPEPENISTEWTF